MSQSLRRLTIYLGVVMGLGSSCAAAAWRFMPTGRDGAVDYSATDLDDGAWQAVELPHRTWDQLQPGVNVYGWYRCHFTPAPVFAGRDMVLKLGIIDDVDETYCNGVKIGSTGSLPPSFASAYNEDREYLIPAQVLRYGEDNAIAVKVYDGIGTGGLLGAPRLGYRVSETDRWRFMACGADGAANYSAPDLHDEAWDRVDMPDEEWDARQPKDNVFGWYRLHFTVPQTAGSAPLVLDLGLILDADETYLNGVLIGKTGHFPPQAHSALGEARLYELPGEVVRHGGDNVLAIKVFNDHARGGTWGTPAFLACAEGLASEESTEHAIRLRKSGQYEQALALLAKLRSTARTDAEQADALDELTVVYHRLGREDEALAAFAEMVKEYPYESCSRAALGAVRAIQKERGALSAHGCHLGQDRETQGDWWLNYGNGGFILSAMAGDCDIFGEPGWCGFADPLRGPPSANRPFSYSASISEPASPPHYNWVWSWDTADRRALINPVTGGRTAACNDDKGEEHPFDNEGPDLKVELDIPDGWWLLSAYLVDWDWRNTWHPRALGLVLSDDDGHVLAVADTGKFGSGVWERFGVLGPRKVILRISKQYSVNSVLSGVFLDRVPRPVSMQDLALTPTSAAPDLRGHIKEYELLCSAPIGALPEYHTSLRVLHEELDQWSRASVTDPKDRCLAGWLAWQVQAALPGDPRLALERAPAAAAGLQEAFPVQADAVLRRTSELLAHQRRYSLARALAEQAYRPDVLASLCAGAEEGFTELVTFIAQRAAWDRSSAVECLELALRALDAIPPQQRVNRLVRLGEAFGDQDLEMALCEIRGPVPLTSVPPRIATIPSLASRTEDALLSLAALTGDALTAHAVEYLTRRGEFYLQSARALCHSSDWPGATLRSWRSRNLAQIAASPVLESAALRLVFTGLPAVGDPEYARRVVSALNLGALEPELAAQLSRALAELALDEDAARCLQARLSAQPPLDLPHRLDLYEKLAGHLLRSGDPAAAREVLELLLPLALTGDISQRSVVAHLRALRRAGSLYAQSRDTAALRELLGQAEEQRARVPAEFTQAYDTEISILRARLSVSDQTGEERW